MSDAAGASSAMASQDARPLASDARALVLLGLLLLALGVASWRPVPAGVWHDDGVYLLIGKALAGGDGLIYAGVPGDLPATKFPPLYPLVLALLWLTFGSIGTVTLAAVALNLLLLAGAGVLLASALGRSGSLGRYAAPVVAGAALLAAEVWRVALVPLSESLFVALVAAALACWPAASRRADRRGAVVLAVVLTAAVLTRSAGIAVVGGFAVALGLRRGVHAAAAISAAPLAAWLGWTLWASARARAIPRDMADILGPYGSWLGGQLERAPLDFVQALPGHAREFGTIVFGFLLPGISGAWLVLAAIPIGLLVATGLVLVHRRLPPLTWVTLAYAGMLLVWPYVDRRLVAPLHPLLVVALGIAVLELTRRATSRRALRVAVAALGLAWVLGHATVSGQRIADEWAVAAYRLRAGRLAAAVETLQRTAPPTAVVGAPEFWAALHLHGGWLVAPSARFLPRAEGDVPIWGTPQEQLQLWWVAGVDHLLLEQAGQIHGPTLDLLEERCPGSVGILATMPPQMLVRIDWREECVRSLGLDAAGRRGRSE